MPFNKEFRNKVFEWPKFLRVNLVKGAYVHLKCKILESDQASNITFVIHL